MMIVLWSVLGVLVTVSSSVILFIAIRRLTNSRSQSLTNDDDGHRLQEEEKKETPLIEKVGVREESTKKECTVVVGMTTMGDALQSVQVNIEAFTLSTEQRAHGILFSWDSPNEQVEGQDKDVNQQ